MATQGRMGRLQASFNRKVKAFHLRHPSISEISKTVKDLPSVNLANAPAIQFFELCDQHFGDDWIWSSSMWNEVTTVYFKDQTDAVLFRLLVDYKSIDSSC